MTDEEIAALAKAAGLEALAARYPEDLRAALETLARHRAALRRDADPMQEPTPAFRLPAP
ncbi:MAG: hypothetical protein N3D18_01990 [Roseococcus sp.]|nr:hypothetical protein [Roseococcus sp.]